MNGTPVAPHRRPLWEGAIAAALVAPLAYTLVIFVGQLFEKGPANPTLWRATLTFMLAVGLPISTVAAFTVGLPLAIAMRSRGWLSGPWACGLAVVIGALALPLGLGIVARGEIPWTLIGLGAAFGLISGVAFCLAAGVSWRLRLP